MPLWLDLAYAATLGPHYLWHRLATGKYGPAAGEKLGALPERSGPAPALWLHAVSVGEAVAAKPLVKAFGAAFPDWELRISTTTATGREVAQKAFGAEKVFYYPLDFSWMVERAFGQIRPNLVVLMELEVWPHFLQAAQARGLPVVVANTRITERSAKRFALAGAAGRRLLDGVTLWLCQSDEYAGRQRGLGVTAEKVVVVGSLKYDSVPTTHDPAWRTEYRALLGVNETAPVVLGGSTHPGEEEALLAAWLAHGRREAGGKLVLVPRHPERLAEVETLAGRHAPVVRRSTLAPDRPATAPIILVDTMGELFRLYAAADAVFVGGSLIPHGGQNVMEPCGLGRPTLIGPSYFNFNEAVDFLRAGGGLRVIGGREELAPALASLLTDPAGAAELGRCGRELLLARQGATARTVERLRAVIEASKSKI